MTTSGRLWVNCTCEADIVLATADEVWQGTPMSCGAPGCAGRPPNGQRPRGLAKCGTPAGYARHWRAREKACAACLAAKAADNAAHKRRREGA